MVPETTTDHRGVELPRAKQESTCRCCGETIAVGEVIYPLEQLPDHRTRTGLDWAHLPCVTAGGAAPPPIPVCKHIRRGGHCHFESKCFFSHPADVALEAVQRIQQRRLNPNAKVANRGEGRRNGVKNDGRAAVFRRWLADQWGTDFMRSGTGLLDIAGGKGELAWELQNLSQIPTTVLEPRALDFSACRKKFERGLYWRNPLYSRYVEEDVIRGKSPVSPPKHLRLVLDSSILEWVQDNGGGGGRGVGNNEAFESSLQMAKLLRWTRKGLHEDQDETSREAAEADEKDDLDLVPTQAEAKEREEAPEEELPEGSDYIMAASDGEVVTSGEDALDLIRNSSAIVALHPDQAAGPAVELALSLNKPFAVVPCCVYGLEFPKRRLKDGARVRTYEDLVNYLQELSPEIRREDLDFEGKHTVLYTMPT